MGFALSNEASETSLVIFPGALGDLVCFLPALEEIARRGGARPALLCQESFAPLVESAAVAVPYALEGRYGSWLFSSDPPAEAAEIFGRFAMIECFTGSGVAEVEANLARWAPGRARIHPFRPSGREHLAVHFLRRLGLSPSVLPEARLELSRQVLERGRAKLSSAVNRCPRLVVHPGSGGARKRWSRDGFVQVTTRWTREGGGAMVILGPAECREADLWRGAGFAVETEPDLLDLAGLLAAADVYVGNDSGPSHLAAALGARGVVVFGPTDPKCWRPLSSRIAVVSPEPWSAIDRPPSDTAIHIVGRELRRHLRGASP